MTIESLVDELIDAADDILPVHAIQELIDAGEAAVGPLLDLVKPVGEAGYDMDAVWAAIALGQLRAAAAAPVLAGAIGRVASDDRIFPVPAAEALANIGVPAMPAIRTLGASSRRSDRLWAYYAAGRLVERAAYEFLLTALESDPEMCGAVAIALSDVGDAAAIEPLYRALQSAPPSKRPEIEEAIRQLHLRPEPYRDAHADWRVRYRLNDFLSCIPVTWPAVVAIMLESGERKLVDAPIRSLDAILADAIDAEEPSRCENCGEPKWMGTGIPVCAETAAAIPALQSTLLQNRLDALGEDDLFDVLDDIEADLVDASVAPKPRTKRAQDRRDDEVSKLRIEQAGLIWAFEQGAKTVSAACATLMAEATRAANEHGDVMGVFADEEPEEPPQSRRVGRNDPCPCGSGRKYKKCCLLREAAKAVPRSGAREMVPAAGLPELFTMDNEPVAFSRAHFDVTDHDAVSGALNGCPELDADNNAETFVWFREIDEEQRRTLGVIRLERTRLVLECMSRERLDRGKQLLESIAGRWLVHRLDSEQDPWQAVSEAREREPRPPCDEVPPEIAGPLVRKILDAQYRNWPDEPLPALDGRSAREAVRSGEGRHRVVALLKSFDEMEQRKDPALRYDFTWIWQELGLERERPLSL